MKKFFAVTSAIATLITSQAALANTQGSYLGMDALSTKTTFFVRQNLSGETYAYNQIPSNSHTSYGFGLNYKYAFNFNDFFIAPGLILEQNSVRGSRVDGIDEERLQVRNRYGVKADFGYDISKTIAPYLTIGYAEVSYKTRGSGVDSGDNLVTAVNNGQSGNWFGGAGVKFDIGHNFALNLEYNYQRIKANTTVPTQATYYIDKTSFMTRLDIVKLGLSYNF